MVLLEGRRIILPINSPLTAPVALPRSNISTLRRSAKRLRAAFCRHICLPGARFLGVCSHGRGCGVRGNGQQEQRRLGTEGVFRSKDMDKNVNGRGRGANDRVWRRTAPSGLALISNSRGAAPDTPHGLSGTTSCGETRVPCRFGSVLKRNYSIHPH